MQYQKVVQIANAGADHAQLLTVQEHWLSRCTLLCHCLAEERKCTRCFLFFNGMAQLLPTSIAR